MLRGQLVLVSGGSRGIGQAVVKEFAERGANVAFTYHANGSAADDLVAQLRSAHPKQTFYAARCDARDAEETATLISELAQRFGERIDVLVNNAGITRDGLLASMEAEDWSDVLDVNLTGVFNLTQRVVFQMMKQGSGSIVCISSVAGLYGNAGQANYAASKAGIVGFAKSVSKEVARRGVRVNVVAPGFIDTDMTAAMGDAAKVKLVSSIGMRRMGESAKLPRWSPFWRPTMRAMSPVKCWRSMAAWSFSGVFDVNVT